MQHFSGAVLGALRVVYVWEIIVRHSTPVGKSAHAV